MAIQNALSIETRFQLNNTNKNFKITDDTDYAAEGIALSDVIGALVITNPLGSVIHSTVLPLFDIDLDVSTFIDTILLPLVTSGDVMAGNYTINYTIRVAGAVQPGDYTKTFNYNFSYTQVSPNITVTVDLINSTLTSVDNTPYQTELTSNTLTHTIFPPNGLDDTDFPDQVVSTVTNVYSGITTKTWTAKISNIVEFTYSDGLIIDDTIIGDTEKDIIDDVNICNLQCNMRALVDRYTDALVSNPVNAENIYNEQLAPALTFAFMYTSNIKCGNFEKAEEYYQQVLKFTGSQLDCQCADDETPTLILASGGGGGTNTYVVDACGANNALTVSSNTIGDTTTFTICFNQALFDKLTALTDAVITSSDGSVTVGSSTVNFTTTWNITVPAQNQEFQGIIEIDLSDKTVVPAISFKSGYSFLRGTLLQAASLAFQNVGSLAVFQANTAVIEVSGYKALVGGEFIKPFIEVMETQITGSAVSVTDGRFQSARVIKHDEDPTNKVYLQFFGADGFPVTGEVLYNFDNIKIAFQLKI